MRWHQYCPGIQSSAPMNHATGHNRSASVPILLAKSSLPIPEPLIVTPTILPTSFTPTHSGTTSASNLTHLVASSFPIGFRNDICKCCTTVGIVNEACVTRDFAASALASSSQCFFEDAAKLSRTGAIPGRRWRADIWARSFADGGRGRVDWWSCLALSREKRSVERAPVCLPSEGGERVLFAVVIFSGVCWARIAPAFRSSRRR